MEHVKGWTAVVVWLTVALALLFFHVTWPDLDAWLKDHQHLSGWAQGIGAILAILGAYHLASRQITTGRVLERERQLDEAVRRIQITVVILANAHSTFDLFLRDFEKRRAPPYRSDHGEWARLKDGIAAVDPFACPSPEVVTLLLQLPSILEAAILARQRVWEGYFREGGLRLKGPSESDISDMTNKISQAMGVLMLTIDACADAKRELESGKLR